MPSNLHIVSGNHLEALADGLAERVASRPGGDAADPLATETIVVQSKGMQRWISMAIARRNGICANFAFPFPNAFLEETYAKAIGELPENEFFAPQTMTFRIMALLNGLADRRDFAPIRGYLSANASPLKRYQLAGKIADVFDQYLVFRPDLITAWETGRDVPVSVDAAWQRLLWQTLRAQSDELHRADLQKRLVRHLMDTDRPAANLPRRVSVFGISYLPLFHLQVLDALAYRIPVHLFLLNPCRQYWTDIVSEHQMTRIRSKSKNTSGTQDHTAYMERGNRLLASWGHQGRQFFGLTQQMEGDLVDLFKDNRSGTVLGTIQQDILDLKDRSRSDEKTPPVKGDASLQVHICHSPMREVEVLHDRLLGILDDEAHIFPGDILVMTPDIARYAPYIHAVFGKNAGSENHSIPYTVADQTIPRESRVVDAFLRILDLIDGRFEASRILILLEYASIRKRFSIDAADLPQIENWVREANIRWGWDGAHRKKHGLPRFKENTWRMGLDRLLLGYAMSSQPDELFADISPHQGIEGSDSHILGAFIHFCEALHHLLDRIPERAGLVRWRTVFTAMLEALFEPDDASSRDIQMLREIIAHLERIDRCVEGSQSVSFEVMRQFLSDHLNRASYGTGFLGGGVTFCAMLPMRSIPAKVICLLGMQHDAFPQDLREPGFNLISAEPRPGDRSKRDDDKYLFIEALLSARSIFYISYIGRDIQDNSPKPPSVLVNELLEYASEHLGAEEEQLITEHPLQAFSAAYFDPDHPNLFSYSKENMEASRHMTAPGEAAPFFKTPIPAPPASWRHCELDQICRFFSHPTRYLMEQRLGITFWGATAPIPDIETFNLNPLDFFKVSQNLLEAREEGGDPEHLYQALQAAGQLPHGRTGLAAYDDIRREVDAFAHTLERLVPTDDPRHHQVEIDLPPFTFSGQLAAVYPEAMVVYRLARLRPSDLLSAFIHHLALSISPGDHLPGTTRLICKDAVWEFQALAEPATALQAYLNHYWQGLQSPLPFFGRTSFAYAFDKIVRGKSDAAAIKTALNAWKGGHYHRGDAEDEYNRKCFAEKDVPSAAFASLAVDMFTPVFAAGRQLPAGSHRTPAEKGPST